MKEKFGHEHPKEGIGPGSAAEEANNLEGLEMDPRSSEDIIKDYEGKGWRHIKQSESFDAIASGKEVVIAKPADGERLFFEK